MKCQRNASPYSACFASRSCARFSPTTVMPASTSAAMPASADVLRRRDDRHRRADLRLDAREARADLVRRRHRSPLARRAAQPSRRCEKKSSGCRACRGRRARPARRRRDAARVRPPTRDRVAVARQVGVVAGRHLRPDLVAARADRRPDHRGLSARRRAPRHPPRRHPRREPRQPACSTASARQPSVRRDGDREAVGGHREHREPRLVGPEPVPRVAAAPAPGAMHGRRVDLAVEGQTVVRRPDRLAGAAGGSRRLASGSSPVPRLRLSDSYGPSLTPPTRVVNATTYPGCVPPDHPRISFARAEQVVAGVAAPDRGSRRRAAPAALGRSAARADSRARSGRRR